MKYSEWATSFLNVAEGTVKHRQIIDLYNSVTPRPRGYKVTYNDAWCAVFATVCMDRNGGINVPRECSVNEMWKQCKKRAVKTPAVDDLIFYDWNGDNIPDHVGIIDRVGDTYILSIEGNKSHKVGSRVVKKDSSNIFGYARIARRADYDELSKVAKKVIRGDYGNGVTRKNALTTDGYTVAQQKEIQNIVNEMLKQ